MILLKKTEYDKLVKKVNIIQTTDTSTLVKKLSMTEKLVKSEKIADYSHSNKYITTSGFGQNKCNRKKLCCKIKAKLILIILQKKQILMINLKS